MNGIISLSVIVVSLAIAHFLIRKESIHCSQLDECILLVREIKSSAFMFSESFCDIILDFNNSSKFSSLDFMENFKSETEQGNTPPVAWKNAVLSSSCSLYQWERDSLIEYGNKMCCCSREEISEISDYVTEILNAYRQSAAEKKTKTTKTNAVCTVSAGVMIGLLIL